ncbi:hypothetical protein EKL97_09495 [Flavobacterium sp. LS1P28]|uniref:hypothetical protein n=1 Tax=Flavobacterium sp. LS1P28 TaxID=2497752 RepID=UPI000F83BB4E|nr:hypothetical protein [Flavobacterium sp. LS1P28]RTY80971.1 hypothetical protein EKL97_09495 [Flavobacterium sp. LS1P28]
MLVCLSFSSCETEKFDSNLVSSTFKDDVVIKNGRLFFQSKDAFVRVYQQYADESDEKISVFLQPFYEEGFYSLRPIVTEKNEDFLYMQYRKKINDQIRYKSTISSSKISSSANMEVGFNYLDEIEDIIGDDTFASLLNSDGEIQVGFEIYKYTDVGLFIADEEKYTVLEDYLNLNDISSDLMVETPQTAKERILDAYPNGGVTYIDSDLVYFKMQPIESNEGSVFGGVSSYTPTSSSIVSTDPSYSGFLSNLSDCDPHSGIFGSLFGDNNVCIDAYETRRRVKTKAFNYNYLLVYHLGVKCVNQYRGWTGFWRVEATDEIRLVVEAAQFEYDVDKLLNSAMTYNQLQEKAYYLNDKKILYQPNSLTIGGYTYTDLNHSSLNQIFQNDGLGLTFEFFGTGWPLLDDAVQGGIDSSLKASKLNEYFYNGLYSSITAQLRSALGNNSYTPPANRTFVAKFPHTGKVIIQKSVLNQGLNIGVREKSFDFGAEIKLSAGDSGGTWEISNIGAGDQLIRPKNFKVKMIGAVRHGSEWHGSKFHDGID